MIVSAGFTAPLETKKLASTTNLSGDFQSAAAPVVALREAAANKSQPASPPPKPSPIAPLEEVERRHIESVLTQAKWMIEGERGAARMLNLNPSTLRSRMQKLGIKRPTPS